MESPIVQGCPYVTFFFTDATPQLTSRSAIAENFQGVYTGDVFRVPLNNGQMWMIYASKNITFNFKYSTFTDRIEGVCSVNPCIIRAVEPFNGVIRLAVVPDDADAAPILDQCRHVIPVGATANGLVSDQKLTYTYEFKTTTTIPSANNINLLMMALPHHVSLGVDLAIKGGCPWYTSIKGGMHGVIGDKWTMEMDLIDVWWDSVKKIDPLKAEVVRGALLAESRLSDNFPDPYNFGKRLAAEGRLAIIADELGECSVARFIRDRMKSEIAPWLTGSNKDALIFDPVWGGIISTAGNSSQAADYGSGFYNDHHFQYGYFVYAAAAIGKGDPEWLKTNIQPVLDLVRDYANPQSDDPYFPRLRYFDRYACHSWASGLFVFQDGKNQESTSEAVNAYYAMALLGKVLEHEGIIQAGVTLFNLEIVAARTYWQIPSPETSIYPSPFSENGTVGILWSGKVDYATWFGSNLEYIHCIQMIPFTPVSSLLFSPEWIRRVLEKIGHLRDSKDVQIGWRGLIWMVTAVIDRDSAWKGFTALCGEPDLGNSITNALYWIATQ